VAQALTAGRFLAARFLAVLHSACVCLHSPVVDCRTLKPGLNPRPESAKNGLFKFALWSEPEFHEEWLRDGPCDATTTGPGNLGHRCQLSPDVGSKTGPAEGNMRFGDAANNASRLIQLY